MYETIILLEMLVSTYKIIGVMTQKTTNNTMNIHRYENHKTDKTRRLFDGRMKFVSYIVPEWLCVEQNYKDET